ncbi:MAG: ATP-binding cassette domain-containing protein [Bacteroidetes bacterium]|nr:ATP-binding cassette domain-containing protein [Bacteroidota bacterium]
MSDSAIKVEGVSKLYRLGEIGTGTISHDLNRWWHRVRGKEDPYAILGEENKRDTKGSDWVWAIQDINFDVKKGEVLGIIGKNGAGKSTLLKVLSRVTSPTKGIVKSSGRIASLLEVGTGFHPELTGRENIFLNGAILGMTKTDIKRNFDEIVDFSGVERYIDTPVKRYSSGMYVRLAFAVAAYLEPEILIVDEVLAVGDAEFQKKCLGRMKDVSVNDGRTVLFVSHNMAAVRQLCTSAIVLKNGKLVFEGTQNEGVNYYQSSHNTNSEYIHDGNIEDALGNDNIRLLRFEVKPATGNVISVSSGFEIDIEFFNAKENINLDVTVEMKNTDEIVVFHTGTVISDDRSSKRGIYRVKTAVPVNDINAGVYKFKIIFGESQRYVLYAMEDVIQFEIMNEASGSNSSILPGIMRLQVPFETTFLK